MKKKHYIWSMWIVFAFLGAAFYSPDSLSIWSLVGAGIGLLCALALTLLYVLFRVFAAGPATKGDKQEFMRKLKL